MIRDSSTAADAEDLGDRPGLKRTAGARVRRGAVGRLGHGAEAPLAEVCFDPGEDTVGGHARPGRGVDVRPEQPRPHGALVVHDVPLGRVPAGARAVARVVGAERAEAERRQQRAAGRDDGAAGIGGEHELLVGLVLGGQDRARGHKRTVERRRRDDLVALARLGLGRERPRRPQILELLDEVYRSAQIRRETDPDAEPFLSDDDPEVLRDVFSAVAVRLAAAIDRDGRPTDPEGARLLQHSGASLDEDGRVVIGPRGPLAIMLAGKVRCLAAILDTAVSRGLYVVVR